MHSVHASNLGQLKLIKFLPVRNLLISLGFLATGIHLFDIRLGEASGPLIRQLGKAIQFSSRALSCHSGFIPMPESPSPRPSQVLSAPVNQATWKYVSRLAINFLSYEDGIQSQPSYHIQAELPVEQISYAEIQLWIRRLNELSHLEMQSNELSLEHYIEGHEPGDQYCLPTPDQWEAKIDETRNTFSNKGMIRITLNSTFDTAWRDKTSNRTPCTERCLFDQLLGQLQVENSLYKILEVVESPNILQKIVGEKEVLLGYFRGPAFCYLIEAPCLNEYGYPNGADHVGFRLTRKSDFELPIAHLSWKAQRFCRRSLLMLRDALMTIGGLVQSLDGN